MLEETLSIIKPDATAKSVIGKIVARFEEEGFEVVAMKKKWLSKSEAEGFYAEHKARPFFGELTAFMTSGPVVLMVLRGESAIDRNREIMGATNPEQAKPNTLRKLYGANIGENAVHGSDSKESAAREVAYFFSRTEVYSN